MRGLILAAGRGSRMLNLASEMPKCMLEFRGRPLIDWQIAALRVAGATSVGIVTGYRDEILRGKGDASFHNSNWESTNMVSSLLCAEEWLDEDECIVSYSDIFFFGSSLRDLVRSDANLAITYDTNWLALWSRRFQNPLDDAENFKIDKSSRLTLIGGRPYSTSAVGGQYMGIIKTTPAGWKILRDVLLELPKAKLAAIDMTQLFAVFIKRHPRVICCIPYRDLWMEFDSPTDVLVANELTEDINLATEIRSLNDS